MSKFKSLKRFLLFTVFVYFVSMMLVMGNGQSFLGRYLSSYYLPIANSIGLNTTWNFFSPDPASTMYFRIVTLFEDGLGHSLQEPIEEFYPETRDEAVEFRIDKRRNTYAMRWFILDPERIKNYFIPWKCHQTYGENNFKPTKVQIEFFVNRIPSLDSLLALKSESFDSLLKQEEITRNIYDCDNSDAK